MGCPVHVAGQPREVWRKSHGLRDFVFLGLALAKGLNALFVSFG